MDYCQLILSPTTTDVPSSGPSDPHPIVSWLGCQFSYFLKYSMPGARNTAENGNVWYFALLQELNSGWKCARKQKFASKFLQGQHPQTKPLLWEVATPSRTHPSTILAMCGASAPSVGTQTVTPWGVLCLTTWCGNPTWNIQLTFHAKSCMDGHPTRGITSLNLILSLCTT